MTAVSPAGVSVALPQGLRGFCPLREACERTFVQGAVEDDELMRQMRRAVEASFPVGTFVPCVVNDVSEDDVGNDTAAE